MRLSTDIDIIVAPDTDVDTYISKASTIFPFRQCEEQVRIGKNSMEKIWCMIHIVKWQRKKFLIGGMT